MGQSSVRNSNDNAVGAEGRAPLLFVLVSVLALAWIVSSASANPSDLAAREKHLKNIRQLTSGSAPARDEPPADTYYLMGSMSFTRPHTWALTSARRAPATSAGTSGPSTRTMTSSKLTWTDTSLGS
jgi:hypothetical protein